MRLAKTGKRSLCLLAEVNQRRFPDLESYITAILECENQKSVQEVHTQIVKRGFGDNLFLSSCLVHRYLHCGSVWEAWKLFPQLHETDVITWTRLIAAFAQNGHFQSSVQVFREMQLQGVPADSITFVTLLNTCAKFGALEQGRQFHTYLLEKGIELASRVGNSLVDLYAKCMSLEEARNAFNSLLNPDVVSWNTLIAAHASLVTILNACVEPSSTKQIHDRVLELGLSSETVVCNALINMYGKAGKLETAREIFESCYKTKDLISWNVIISAYILSGVTVEAFKLYSRMQLEGVLPAEVAFLTVINACNGPDDLTHAKQIHASVAESSCCCSHQVGNALIAMYGRCCSVEDSETAFDGIPHKDVVSWNSLIAAYALNGFCDHALQLFHRMQLEGLLPTNVTFVSVLNACCEPYLKQGRLIHASVVESGYESNDIVVCALVDMYCKCNSREEASRLFFSHLKKNVVLWTALIGGYSEAGCFKETLQLFKQMQLDGFKPNKVTFVTVLNACANMISPAAAAEGRAIQSQFEESGYESDMAVKNALLNLLGKTGDLRVIEITFGGMEQWDVIAGTVVISAYSQQGFWRKSIEAYHQMLLQGMKPNSTTFAAVLTSCSALTSLPVGEPIHASIVETGCSVVPIVQSSLINFYGKCGNLKLARKLFEEIVDKNMVVAWTAIMTGYAQHGQMVEARKIFQRMQQEGVKPDSVAFISVLSVCSHAGLVEDACYFFVSMTKELEINATIEHYGCMIDLLGRTGWLNEAESLIKRMSVRPDAVLWTSLLGSSRVHGNLKLAEHAAQQVIELEPENAATYVQLSNTYALAKSSSEPELNRSICAASAAKNSSETTQCYEFSCDLSASESYSIRTKQSDLPGIKL